MAQETAVLYARYSSDKQREASIDDQLRVCRDFCEAQGIEIVGQYTDYAMSGKTDQRPEFRRMIAAAPESDYIVVYMFDRFSRDRYDSATYKRMLRECGVRVLSAQERVEDTPEGGLQEGMLEIMSEYFVKDLARKVRRGMEGNALQAKNNGYTIFGYRTDPETRRYVIDEHEAGAVREVYSRYIGGETTHAIAAAMAEKGWRTSTGRRVDSNWVRRILNRRAYIGLYSWGGIEVEDGMPRIIDEETFQRARATPRRKRRDNEHWASYRLTGRLYCGLCGLAMHGYSGTGRGGRRYHYYGCKEDGGCGRRGVHREVVEGAVARAVLDVASDEGRMRMVARRVIEAYEQDGDEDAELRSCEDEIAQLEREQINITNAVVMGFVNDEIIRRNDEIKDRLASLKCRHGILLSQSLEVTEDDVVEFLLHGFNQDDEDFIFKSFISKAYLFEDCILVVFNFRDEVGDLAEARVALAEARKNPNPVTGFGCKSHGVGGGT